MYTKHYKTWESFRKMGINIPLFSNIAYKVRLGIGDNQVTRGEGGER